jgi:ubiquitin-activating enzyme E1
LITAFYSSKYSSIVDVVREVSRKEVPEHRRALVFEVMASDANDEDVEIPYIKYNI